MVATAGPGDYPAARLVPYDPGWPSRYALLAAAVLERLGPSWRVEHVGSTSVPGLVAKPEVVARARSVRDDKARSSAPRPT